MRRASIPPPSGRPTVLPSMPCCPTSTAAGSRRSPCTIRAGIRTGSTSAHTFARHEAALRAGARTVPRGAGVLERPACSRSAGSSARSRSRSPVSGFPVTLSEKFAYYYGAFDDLRGFLEGEGIEVWDEDLTEPLDPPRAERFELVTALAILEHLASTPRPLMENLAGAPGARRQAAARGAEHRVLAQARGTGTARRERPSAAARRLRRGDPLHRPPPRVHRCRAA